MTSIIKTHFINGEWQEGSGKEFSSENPVTKQKIWTGKAATETEANHAINAARKNFQTWSQTSLEDRISYLTRYQDNLTKNKEELATVISEETGKPFWESLTEAASMAAKVPLSIQAYKERMAESMRQMLGATSHTRFKPHGVCAVFGPYNFPGHLANGHIVPALLAGNTVIFKPSRLTPAVAQKTIELWELAGIPKGVLNLIQGSRVVGQSLLENPDINGVFFTGGSSTGIEISKTLVERPQVILALEMGGNNPLVVHETKDINAASHLTIRSAFITAGQRCSCARRLIVPEGKEGDRFIEKLIEDMKKIKVGAHTDRPEPFMGSVIDDKAAQSILDAQEKLKSAGAQLLMTTKPIQDKMALLSPGLIDITAVKDQMDSEIFGPLLQLIRVKDFDNAITEANNTAYGLTAGLICDKKEMYKRFYNEVRAGVINWNNQLTGASSAAPFGGVGLSGNNRPSGYFAADYCSYPVASLESDELKMPEKKLPGL